MRNTALHRDAKIYVAGHTGLVGSAILRKLTQEGYCNIVTRPSKQLDLTDQQQVKAFFAEEKPDFIFLCAAKVGGIVANNSYPATFIHHNLMIQNHVIHEAMKNKVSRLLFLAPSCIYPRECPQPIKEEYLLTGPLEPTNRPYAVAKIAGIEMCWSYNRQYGTRFMCGMSTNLYGPGDSYDLENSHVLPALMRKMHEAKMANKDSVPLWGDGSPRREFLHSDDIASAALFLLSLPEANYNEIICSTTLPPIINIGAGHDLTIRELVQLVAEIVGFTGKLEWDAGRPNGTPQKLLETSRLTKLGWSYRIPLKEGLARTYQEAFLSAESLF